jgi:hypothetical protein
MVTGNTNKARSQLIRQLEDEIDNLRRERDEQAALVAQMREQVADYDALIERLIEAFAKLKVEHELLQQPGEWDEVKKYSGRVRRPPGSKVS